MSDGDHNATHVSPKMKRQRKSHATISSQLMRGDSLPINPRRIRLSQQNYAAMSTDSSDGFRFGRLWRSCGLLSGDEESTQQDENITQVEQTSNNLKLPEVDNSAQPEMDSQMNQIIQETFTMKSVNNDSAEMTNSVDIPNAKAQKYNQIPNTQSSNPETEDTYVDYRVTHVQGRGDKQEPQTSVDGAYSLVVNSLKLSTV